MWVVFNHTYSGYVIDQGSKGDRFGSTDYLTRASAFKRHTDALDFMDRLEAYNPDLHFELKELKPMDFSDLVLK